MFGMFGMFVLGCAIIIIRNDINRRLKLFSRL
nr:MAG TPA: hypothetical protein [Caudoviricetes sp.]